MADAIPFNLSRSVSDHQELSIAELKKEELRQIRAAVSRAVERKSLRSVAGDIGMSPTGLRLMLDGAEPYAKTWDKLQVWFSLHQKDVGSELPPQTVASLLRRLLGSIPEQWQHGAQLRALNGFEEAFRFAGVAAPAWIAQVKTALFVEDV